MGLRMGSHGLLPRENDRSLFQSVSEKGQGVVEYGLLILLASIIVIAVLVLLGPQTGSIFSVVSSAI